VENCNRAPVEKRHGAAQNTGVRWRVVKSDQGVGNYGEFVPGGQTPGTSPSCGLRTNLPAALPCGSTMLPYGCESASEAFRCVGARRPARGRDCGTLHCPAGLILGAA